MALNDVVTLELDNGLDQRPVEFHGIAELVNALDACIEFIWDIFADSPAPRLQLTASPRRGSIILDFTINIQNYIPLTEATSSDKDLLGRGADLAGIATFVLTYVFGPLGLLSVCLHQNVGSTPERETTLRRTINDAIAGMDVAAAHSVTTAASKLGCDGVRVSYRDFPTIDLHPHLSPMEIARSLASAYAEPRGIQLLWNHSLQHGPRVQANLLGDDERLPIHRFSNEELRADPAAIVKWIAEQFPDAEILPS